MTGAHFTRALVPLIAGMLFLLGWEVFVAVYRIPRVVLPPPSAIAQAMIDDFPSLLASMWTTLRITLLAFVLAVITGVAPAGRVSWQPLPPATLPSRATIPTSSRPWLLFDISRLLAILGPAAQIAGQIIGPASQVAGQIKTISERKEEPAPAAAPA